jgi:hypothetical protein
MEDIDTRVLNGHEDESNTQLDTRVINPKLVQQAYSTSEINQQGVNRTEDLISSQEKNEFSRSDSRGSQIKPEIANLTQGKFVDKFQHVIYDVDYRSERGKLSTWLRVVYSDGIEIDINIFDDFTEVSLAQDALIDSLARGRIGMGDRVFPTILNYQTTPRLWKARESAIQVMEEYNYQFIMATVPAIAFIITMPMAVMGNAPKATRRPFTGRIARVSGELARFSAAEKSIIQEAKQILSSPEMAKIQAAYKAGQSVVINVGGRIIQYEPGLPASGMTMFGQNGFLIGREAFASQAELTKTVLHELYRLSSSHIGRGAAASGAGVAAETEAAFQFAERAYKALFQ